MRIIITLKNTTISVSTVLLNTLAITIELETNTKSSYMEVLSGSFSSLTVYTDLRIAPPSNLDT